MNTQTQKPSAAFLGASWAALLAGMGAYPIGLRASALSSTGS